MGGEVYEREIEVERSYLMYYKASYQIHSAMI